MATAQLLAPRTRVQVSRSRRSARTWRLSWRQPGAFLAEEVITRGDHNADTVVKKEVYEKMRVPRLWMVEPRYGNVEIYHSMAFGLQWKTSWPESKC